MTTSSNTILIGSSLAAVILLVMLSSKKKESQNEELDKLNLPDLNKDQDQIQKPDEKQEEDKQDKLDKLNLPNVNDPDPDQEGQGFVFNPNPKKPDPKNPAPKQPGFIPNPPPKVGKGLEVGKINPIQKQGIDLQFGGIKNTDEEGWQKVVVKNKPTPGSFYKVTGQDYAFGSKGLLRISAAAYGLVNAPEDVLLGYAKQLNANPYNLRFQHMTSPDYSPYNKRVDLSPAYGDFAAQWNDPGQGAVGKGFGFPVIFIPEEKDFV